MARCPNSHVKFLSKDECFSNIAYNHFFFLMQLMASTEKNNHINIKMSETDKNTIVECVNLCIKQIYTQLFKI